MGLFTPKIKKLVFRSKISVFSGDPLISPLVDCTTMLAALTTYNMLMPLDLFMNNRYYYESRYTVSIIRSRIPFVNGLLAIGDPKMILDRIKGFTLTFSTEPAHSEVFSGVLSRIIDTAKRFPRVLFMVSQMSPPVTPSVLYLLFKDKNYGKKHDKLRKIDARKVSLAPILSYIEDVRYGSSRLIIDEKTVDDASNIEYEYMYMYIIADHDLVSWLLLMNAYKAPLMFGVDTVAYRPVKILLHQKKREVKK